MKYCSDGTTKKFLENHSKDHADKGIFRKTWSTWKQVCAIEEQRKLF